MVKNKLLRTALMLALSALMLIPFISAEKTSDAEEQGTRVKLSSDESEKIVIASRAGTDYIAIYSSDVTPSDQELAKEIEALTKELYGVRLRSKPDTSASAVAKEVLLGNTNRPESASFIEALRSSVALEEDLAWGFACINGKLVYAANSTTAFDYGKESFLTFLKENDFTVSSELSVISTKTRTEYDEEKRKEEEELKKNYIAYLIQKNSEFTQEDFGGEPKSMGPSPYNSPILYPKEGEHPRIFVTADKLDDVRAIMEDPRFKSIVDTFWAEVKLDGCIDGFPIVEYDDPTGFHKNNADGGDWYRYDVDIISALQNKAFAYLLTGDEVYGYEAIIGAKNMMLTMVYSTKIHIDLYHGASHVMIAVAKIYDWCYDLMTEDDKQQMIAGVSNLMAPKMEINFPPTGMSAVTGHGTGPQLLRDYFMCSLAFYDEMPDWWELVGGRYFQETVPVVNKMSEGGWVSQGTCVYGPGKVYDYIISFRLLYISTGQYSYNTEDLGLVPYYVMSHLQPNGLNFQNGDGYKNGEGAPLDLSYLYDIAATFSDPTLTAFIYSQTANMTKSVDPSWAMDFPAAKILIYLSYLPEPEADIYEKLDTVQYYGGNATTMVARNSWSDENAAAVYMKIGSLTMANHDNYDHGTFQIYYKGLLAGTSGNYVKYGSNSHVYYAQSTVAYNGILVFNPALASDTPISGEGGEHDILNGNTYFYSGSQRNRREAGTIENWLGGEYDTGEITGYDMAYSYADGSAEYGYIAGNIASAYDSATVQYLERRMLTVFTDDPDYPMLFFTFDSIESTKSSFRKTYLIHTVKEPTIDEAAMSADIRHGDGRLFVQNLFGAESMEKIGGEGKAYWINGYYKEDGTYVEGKNCVTQYDTTDFYDTVWGRIQFHAPTDSTNTQMLTAMFVTDAANEATPAFEKFESESVYGAKWKDYYTVFLKSRDRQYKEFSFDTEGLGLSKYYISGIESGTWKIEVDGMPVATVDVTEDGGFADFTAPSGKVVFKPTENVVGASGGKIHYMTFGGMLGDDIPFTYRNETDFSLSENVTRGQDTFLGWYTTESYEEGTRVTKIPQGTTGTVKLYAKWYSVFANEDYKNTDIYVANMIKTVNGISYNADVKPGASYTTKTDEDGVKYLEWIEGTKDPIIVVQGSDGKSLSKITAEDECVSYQLSVSKDGDNPIMPFQNRLMSDISYSGMSGVWGELIIFQAMADGTVVLGSSGPSIGTITADKVLNIRVVVDFKNQKLTAYDDIGADIASMSFTVPPASGAPNGVEWRKLMRKYATYIYATGAEDLGASLRVYGLKIHESNVIKNNDLENITIKYEANGGTLADGAPRFYVPGEETSLPSVYKQGSVFGGWYTSKTFDEGTRVEKVPADQAGPFTVYAKWTHQTFVNTDFSGSNISHTVGSYNYAGLTFNAPGGSTFTTKTDENGKEYLEWVKGTADSLIAVNTPGGFAAMQDTSATYIIKLRKKADAPILSTSQIVVESDKNTSGATKWAALTLFKIKENGDIVSGIDASAVVATLTENEISEITLVIDFKEAKMIYYSSEGLEIASFSFSAPAASGATSTLEWQKLVTRELLYFRADNNAISSESALMIYGITIKEGNIFDNAVPSQNDIIYETNGGTLPSGSPTVYDPEKDTPLPIPTNANAVFGGWYTTKTFDEGTRVEKIPKGTDGAFFVYAKWTNQTFINTDFAGSGINHTTGSMTYAGVSFNSYAGGSFTTKTDENGKDYLEWIKGSSDTLIAVSNRENSGNFADMSETSASYSFKFRKKADTPVLSTAQIQLESNMNTSGQSGVWRAITLFKIKENGDIVCGVDDTVVIATLSEDKITEINFVVDFKESKLIFYSEDHEEIGRYAFAVPQNTGATTALEWQKLITRELLYFRADNNAIPADSALMVYGITIAEGNIFGDGGN